MGWHSPYQYGRMPRNTPCVMCHALCCEHRLKEGLTHMQARTHARCACQTCRPVQYTHAHTLTRSHTHAHAQARAHTHMLADTHAYRHVGRYVDMHPVLPLHQHAIAHNTCAKANRLCRHRCLPTQEVCGQKVLRSGELADCVGFVQV